MVELSWWCSGDILDENVYDQDADHDNYDDVAETDHYDLMYAPGPGTGQPQAFLAKPIHLNKNH